MFTKEWSNEFNEKLIKRLCYPLDEYQEQLNTKIDDVPEDICGIFYISLWMQLNQDIIFQINGELADEEAGCYDGKHNLCFHHKVVDEVEEQTNE